MNHAFKFLLSARNVAWHVVPLKVAAYNRHGVEAEGNASRVNHPEALRVFLEGFRVVENGSVDLHPVEEVSIIFVLHLDVMSQPEGVCVNVM